LTGFLTKEIDMAVAIRKIVDISLALENTKFTMRTPLGFKKDMQFEMEVLKEHDSAEGGQQIVRGVHMRLHAGSHVDAPEHNTKGAAQITDLAPSVFVGAAVVADLRHLVPGGAITAAELEKAVGDIIQTGDRILLRTDVNQTYMKDDWTKRSPYLTVEASNWMIAKKVPVLGFDCYHGAEEKQADQPRLWHALRLLSEAGIVTLPSLINLNEIDERRVTLVALPLKIVDAEASPVRAVVLM
jgi:kynurenine formamidase